jgi:hypothetical protein
LGRSFLRRATLPVGKSRTAFRVFMTVIAVAVALLLA